MSTPKDGQYSKKTANYVQPVCWVCGRAIVLDQCSWVERDNTAGRGMAVCDTCVKPGKELVRLERRLADATNLIRDLRNIYVPPNLRNRAREWLGDEEPPWDPPNEVQTGVGYTAPDTGYLPDTENT